MSNYDVLGNIVIVKFPRTTKRSEKLRWAKAFLRERVSVTTVVEKIGKFKGRLRMQATRHLAGEHTKEALYKENACVFRLNVDSCYFSPRLAAERAEVASLVKPGEHVLVLFGGVAPFAIVIAKARKAARVVSVELSRTCNRYALENVKRNKVAVEVVAGDVRRVLPKINEKFDRVVMARPNLEEVFLDVAFPKVKRGGIIHYYGFCKEPSLDVMKEMILEEATKAKRKIKIVRVKKAGDIGVRTWRYRIDIKVVR